MHACCLGGLRTFGVNFVPVAGPSMTSMMRISLLPAVSEAFLAAPLAGALLFGGIIVPSSPGTSVVSDADAQISGRDAS